MIHLFFFFQSIPQRWQKNFATTDMCKNRQEQFHPQVRPNLTISSNEDTDFSDAQGSLTALKL